MIYKYCQDTIKNLAINMSQLKRLAEELNKVYNLAAESKFDKANSIFDAECRSFFPLLIKDRNSKTDLLLDYFLNLEEYLKDDPGTSWEDVVEAKKLIEGGGF